MISSIQRLLLPLLFLLVPIAAAAQLAGAGTSFVLTVPHILAPNPYQKPIPRLRLTTGATAANVTLRYTATGVTAAQPVPAGTSVEILLDTLQVFLPPEEGKSKLSVQVTSTQPVQAVVVFDRAFVSEAFQALPDTMLGHEYFAVSNDGVTAGAMVTVVGIYDRTRVTITPTATTIGGAQIGRPFTIELGRGEVYQILTDRNNSLADLTGTRVLATKPVGVLSGSPCVAYAIGFPIQGRYNCNPLLEQLVPTDSWGKSFFLAPLYRQESSVYRIMAKYDATDINFNATSFTIASGGFHEIIGGEIYNLRTSKPVMVVQMGTSTAVVEQSRDSAYGEPSMVVLTPQSHWGNSTIFTVPRLDPRADLPFPAVPWKYYAQITIDRSFESSITIDGGAPTYVSRRYFNANFYGIMEVDPGRHTVAASDTFTLTAYAYSSADAISYPTAAIRSLYPLQAPFIRHVVCANDYDTTFTIRNWTGDPITIDSVAFVGDLVGTLIQPASLPITIQPGAVETVTIRFRGLRFGKNDGSVIFYDVDETDLTERRVASIVTELYADNLNMVPSSGTSIDLGGIPSSIPYIDTVITLRNDGVSPLYITAIVAPPAAVVQGGTFPMTLAPGETRKFTLRYTPLADGTRAQGSISLKTANCITPSVVDISGLRRSGGFIEAGTPEPVRILCGPKAPDTFDLEIDNKGDRLIRISMGDIIGLASGEFTILTPMGGMMIPPGEKSSARIIFTPNGLGVRDATVRIVSDAINEDTLFVPLDVRNDTIILRTSVDTLRFGMTSACDPPPSMTVSITNLGTIELFGMAVTPEEPSLVTTDRQTIDYIPPGGTEQFVASVPIDAAGDLAQHVRIAVPGCDDTLLIPVIGRRDPPAVRFDRDTIDFGVLAWCAISANDSALLINSGAVPNKLRLERPAGSDPFRQRTPVIFPDEIPGDDTIIVRYQFRPTAIGTFFDSLSLVLPSCSYPLKVYLSGIYDTTRPVLSANDIDFGMIPAGNTQTGSVIVRNDSKGPYRFTVPIIEPSAESRGSVTLIDPPGDFVVEPGESVEITLEYLASDSGALTGRVRLPLAVPCGDTLDVGVRGRPLKDRGGIFLAWADTVGFAGEVVGVDLIARRSVTDGESEGEEISLTAGMSYDPTVFFPIGLSAPTPGFTPTFVGISNSGTRRVYNIRVDGALKDSAVVARIDGIVTLGREPLTTLEFIDPKGIFVDGALEMEVLDTTGGVLLVADLCDVGGNRLVRSSGLLRVAVDREGPDGRALTYELVEDGVTTLTIHDALGRSIETVASGVENAGVHRKLLDVSRYPAGLYWLRLGTPTQTLVGRFVIVR